MIRTLAACFLVTGACVAWPKVPLDRLWAEGRGNYLRLARMAGSGQRKANAEGMAAVPAWAGLLSADDEIVVGGRGAPGMMLFMVERRCAPGRSSFDAIAFAPGGAFSRLDSAGAAVWLENAGRLGDWYHLAGTSSWRRPPAWVHCTY